VCHPRRVITGGRVRWDRSVAAVAAVLAAAVVVSVPVWAWGIRALERRGFTNRWSEGLFYGVGGWDRPISLRWLLLGLLILVVVDRCRRPLRRGLLWGAAGAVVVARLLAYLDDPSRTTPAPWWAWPFIVPLLCLVFAAIGWAIGARAESGILAGAAAVNAGWPQLSADIQFGRVPFEESPPLPSSVIGLVAAVLIWLLLSPGRRAGFAVTVACVAGTVLVLDIGLVLAMLMQNASAEWALRIVEELRSLGPLLTVLLVIPAATRWLSPAAAASPPRAATAATAGPAEQ
jgi:hypothetical protein